MTLTPDALMERLSGLGYKPRLAPTEIGVTVVQPCRYYQNRNGNYEMELEIRPEAGGSVIRILGPGLGFSGQGLARDNQTLLEVQSAFRFLRMVEEDGEGPRPLLEHPCLLSESALPDSGLNTLLGWAVHTFDPAMAYLQTLARTGQREPRYLASEPPELARLMEKVQDLQARLEEAEREMDKVRQVRVRSSLVLPKFL